MSLKKLDYLNRDQLQILHNLGQVRNANRVLKGLEPYLSHFREEYSTVYYLNAEGREYVNSEKIRRKTPYVNHVIMRNDFYIYIKPQEWKNEVKIGDGKYSVVCDAWYKKNGFNHFLEVDVTQKMKENKAKVKQYLGLFQNGLLANHLGYFPKLIWLTTTDLRKKQLLEVCKGIPCEVYIIGEIR